jgi:hypothetical protein
VSGGGLKVIAIERRPAEKSPLFPGTAYLFLGWFGSLSKLLKIELTTKEARVYFKKSGEECQIVGDQYCY